MRRALLVRLCCIVLILLIARTCVASAWSPDSTINTPTCTAIGQQSVPSACPDGAGGVYFAWEDNRSHIGGGYVPDIYAQRLSSNGSIAAGWLLDGIAVCSTAIQSFSPMVIGDGRGGAIVAYYDGNGGPGGGIFVQHYAPDGSRLWPANGILVSGTSGRPYLNPAIAIDDSGCVDVAWGDDRSNPGFARSIYAQRIGGDGSLRWDPGGLEVSTPIGFNADPSISAAGDGSIYVSWTDNRVSGTGRAFLQHLGVNGSPLWVDRGIPVTTSTLNQVMAGRRSLCLDDEGGVYVGWSDNYSSSTGVAFVQRITPAGTPSPGWPATGVQARITGIPGGVEGPPLLTRVATGGAFVTWIKGAAIVAQRFGTDGSRLWGDPAVVPFGGRLCSYHDTVSDSAGGIIIATTYNTYVIAQRLDTMGRQLWGTLGLHLASGPSNKKFVAGAPDGAHGAIFAWSDDRNDAGDIYAQNVSANGVLGQDVVAVQVSLESANALPDHVDLRWSVVDESVVAADLERTADGSAWSRIATLARRGNRFEYEDADVTSGHRYGYRLRYGSDGGILSAIAWVDVPSVVTLSFAGPWPQPAIDHADLRLTIPSKDRVRAVILDLQGREVSTLVDAVLPPGQHLIRWNPDPRQVRDGLYFAKLTVGGRVLSRRIIIAR